MEEGATVIPLLIIILGIGTGVLIYFGFRTVFMPKRVATLNALLKQNKSAAAIRLAKQIIAKDGRNTEAHYLLGLAYLIEERRELALMEMKIVNDLGTFGGLCPEIGFRKLVAGLYEDFGQPEEALKEYIMLMKLEPKVAEHFYKTGMLFESRNRIDRAAHYYYEAIERAPKHGDAHFRLGCLLIRQGKPLEAKQELDLSLKYKPDNNKAFFYIGRLLKESRDYVGALLSFEKAQRDPDLKVRSIIERGGCYMSMQNFDQAAVELERALKLSDDLRSVQTLYGRYYLALCYERMTRIDSAIEQWEKIFAVNSTFKDVGERLRQYEDLRNDDRMKDYLTSGHEEFTEICKMVVEILKLKVRDVEVITNGCRIIAVDRETNWVNARVTPLLIWFLRIPDLIDESTVRTFHEEMKKLNLAKGILAASTSFSSRAAEYVERRPIELVNKSRLQAMLKKIDYLPDDKRN